MRWISPPPTGFGVFGGGVKDGEEGNIPVLSRGLDALGWRGKTMSTGIGLCSRGGKERMDALDFDSSSNGDGFVTEGGDRHEGSLEGADENICGAGARELGGSVL